MKTLKSLALVFGVGLFLLSSSIRADVSDKKTTVTFSGPVQVANTQLPAGTYTFKLLESQSDRHIVQIFNQDETHLIATILAIPDYRVEPAGKTVIKFAETSGGSEASGTVPDSGIPIKEWFYPGDNMGQEFPVVAQPQVAAVQPEPAAEQTAPPEALAESPEAAAQPEQPSEPPQAAAPSTEESAAPEATPPQEEAAPAPEGQSAPEQLPQTASQMPLVGLIGILCLAVAASFRIIWKIWA
jgi:hypothetical protein